MLKELDRIVRKCLKKEPDERYQSVPELLRDLRSLQQNLVFNTADRVGYDAPFPELADQVESNRPFLVKANETPRRVAFSQHRNLVQVPRYALSIVAAFLILSVAGILLYRQRETLMTFVNRSSTRTGHPGSQAMKPWSEMTNAEQLVFIDQQEQHISEMTGDRKVKLNDEAIAAIKKRVDWYVSRTGSSSLEYGREDLKLIYSRAAPYLPEIRRAFEARRIPIVIGIYLPMIESEYKPCFRNEIGATGLFQFMPGTAKRYGVSEQEMCDINLMSTAAAHYIADLMAELGDDSQSMTLVLLSYNRGEEGVRFALRELRDTAVYERNFWSLYSNREKLGQGFTTENANYVPGFFAAAIIGENPAVFGLNHPPLSSLADSETKLP